MSAKLRHIRSGRDALLRHIQEAPPDATIALVIATPAEGAVFAYSDMTAELEAWMGALLIHDAAEGSMP